MFENDKPSSCSSRYSYGVCCTVRVHLSRQLFIPFRLMASPTAGSRRSRFGFDIIYHEAVTWTKRPRFSAFALFDLYF